MYKARYFPTTSFFDATLGPTPSYVWWGIWKARVWLLKWSVWRIGNGGRVSVWWDQWIPRLETPLSPPTHLPLDHSHEKVAFLIDPLTSTWDMATINNLFSPTIVAAIRKIPLIPTTQEDRWIW